jgi:hypothetical protein
LPTQFNGERIIFSTNGMRTTGYPHTKKEIRSLLHAIHTLVKTDNGPEHKRAKSIKFLEENIGI